MELGVITAAAGQCARSGAHPPIQPVDPGVTGEAVREVFNDPDAAALYELLRQMALAAKAPPPVVEVREAVVNSARRSYSFSVRALEVLRPGWLSRDPDALAQVRRHATADRADVERLAAHEGPVTVVGEPRLVELDDAPKAYLPHELIEAMAKAGFGRPSTYAAALGADKLEAFVEKDAEGRLHLNRMGRAALAALRSGGPVVGAWFSVALEDYLEQVERGELAAGQVLAEALSPFYPNLPDIAERAASWLDNLENELSAAPVDDPVPAPETVATPVVSPAAQFAAQMDMLLPARSGWRRLREIAPEMLSRLLPDDPDVMPGALACLYCHLHGVRGRSAVLSRLNIDPVCCWFSDLGADQSPDEMLAPFLRLETAEAVVVRASRELLGAVSQELLDELGFAGG